MNGKQAAGYRAVEWVQPGMTVGLGTGSTAYWAIQRIGERVKEGLEIKAIATSKASEKLAKELNIPLFEAADIPHIDLTIDGADEVNPQMALIKGGGGALLREKMVALKSDKLIVVADASKDVEVLGNFKLPIEVVPFACEWTFENLRKQYDVPMEFRYRDGSIYVTDNGNYIVDASFGRIEDPEKLAVQLKSMTGIVDHGLFVGIAETVVLGNEDGTVTVRTR
ncbi:ribose-5-phosphate isomerase RpiA [Paenibacillus physcomitrellae]|uniref:Ribose-5-phosphate isomerase A n=1 Tax=Paenibacillus physcomitrellae TaxID=1619311 RepID=A0ABQ1GB18_9BACL|nr:ribose-5-phosphate isomerase RpiA [Paenibacillus physcomitrellae]GGA40203.1 ribose-5-phosphate isomerase A [Paenibacillus physcomitrellae]